jgi:hypothetical protein
VKKERPHEPRGQASRIGRCAFHQGRDPERVAASGRVLLSPADTRWAPLLRRSVSGCQTTSLPPSPVGLSSAAGGGVFERDNNYGKGAQMQYDPEERVVLNHVAQTVNVGYDLRRRLDAVARVEGLDATSLGRRIIEAAVTAREQAATGREAGE